MVTTSVSNTFNNAAGESIDDELLRAWLLVLIELQPLMASGHRTRRLLSATQGDTQFVVGPGGVLKRLHPIIERDDAGKIQLFSHHDIRQLERVTKKHPHLAKNSPRAHVPPMDSPILDIDEVVWSFGAEVAALKTCLVLFDWCEQQFDGSLARSAGTKRARDLVRSFVEGPEPSINNAKGVFLGIDPGARDSISALAPETPDESGIAQPGAFDHVFVFIGEPAIKRVTATWLVFGHEAVSFVLHDAYTGGAFSWVLRSSPLKSGGTVGPTSATTSWRPRRTASSSLRFRGDERHDYLSEVVVQLRMDAAALASTLATLSDPPDSVRVCRNAVLHYYGKFRGDTFSFSDVLLHWLVPGWTSEQVTAAVSALEGSHPSLVAPRTLDLDIEMDEDPDWASEFKVLFMLVFEWLYEHFGPIRRTQASAVDISRSDGTSE